MFALLLRNGAPVCQEALDALVSQRVLRHLIEHLVRTGRDMRPCQGSLRDVHWVTNARRDDFSVNAVNVKDARDVTDELNPIKTDIVEAADERTDERGTSSSSEECLIGAEDERDIRTNALLREAVHRLKSFRGHRYLDDDVLVHLGVLKAFLDHAVSVEADHFSTDGTVDKLEDLLQNLNKVSALFGNETWVRRNAGQNSHFGSVSNLGDIRCVDK